MTTLIREKWHEISSYWDTAISSSVGRMITAVAGDFNTELELGELEDFIQENEAELGSALASANTMVESTKVILASDWSIV